MLGSRLRAIHCKKYESLSISKSTESLAQPLRDFDELFLLFSDGFLIEIRSQSAGLPVCQVDIAADELCTVL